eukprot:m.76492 g.76492  ORF g.76492 m.76492 type:complete len:426 (-) comp12562_c0_seq1:4465-5742(-)
MTEVETTASLATIRAAEEEERQRRIEEGQNVNDALLEVQNALIRLRAAREADESMQTEQARRVTEEKKAAVHEQLVRTASQKEASKAMDSEKQRRMTDDDGHTDKVKNVLTEVHEEIIKTFESPRYLKSAQEAKTVVNEELLHAIAVKGVSAAVAEEHSRRLQEPVGRSESQSAKIDDLHGELLAKSSLEQAKKAEELERERRVIEEKMRNVQEDATRKAMAKQVQALVEEEKSRRQKENLKVDEEIAKALSELHTDVIRAVGVRDAKAAADLEQVQRVVEEKKKDVHEQLIRKSSQQRVIIQEEEERSRRIAESAMKQVLGEVRKESTEVNKKNTELEQAMADVLTSVVRYEASRRARQLAQEERVRRITEARREVAQDQLVSVIHRKEAAAAGEIARQEKSTQIVPDEFKAKQKEVLSQVVST